MGSRKGRPPPRLIGLLIDLPDGPRAALAAGWLAGQDATASGGDGAVGPVGLTRELYAAMVDPTRLGARVAGLDSACRDALRALASEPGSFDELLGRVALGRETLEGCLAVLGRLGLVVRVEPSGRPRPAAAPFGSAFLAVPREVASALRLAGVAR
jgi:hypothetical protein